MASFSIKIFFRKENRKRLIEEHKSLISQVISNHSDSQEAAKRLEKLRSQYPYLANDDYYKGIEQSVIAVIDKIIDEYS